MNPILDEIAKTSIQLMLKEPFYGHFFSSVLKDVSDKTDSVAISMSGKQMLKLIVNEDYWKEELKGLDEETTKNLRYGAIKHQILHIVFKHLLRISEFGNKQLYGIASDLAANQYINSNQLTEEAIRLEDFPDFKLDRGQSLDYYYKRLAEELDEMSGGGGGEGDDSEDQENEQENDSNGSKSDERKNQELNQSQQKLKDLLENPNNRQLNQHKFWDEINKMSSAERKMVEAMINDSILNSVQRMKDKQHGLLPAGLQQYIDLLVESLKPNVNWRRILRLFAASSSRTQLKNTIRRPSKRYGTTPGIKIQRKQKLLVAIDTSGSVNDEELKEFFSELYHIWKQGAEIFVVECDAAIHNKYFYNGRPPTVVSGRGGTDFNAPLAYANDDYQPDAIVYFTDGYANEPHVLTRKPILWMITSQGINEDGWDYLPGRKVKMVKQLSF
jgi:predicted metal-dependent peptidase